MKVLLLFLINSTIYSFVYSAYVALPQHKNKQNIIGVLEELEEALGRENEAQREVAFLVEHDPENKSQNAKLMPRFQPNENQPMMNIAMQEVMALNSIPHNFVAQDEKKEKNHSTEKRKSEKNILLVLMDGSNLRKSISSNHKHQSQSEDLFVKNQEAKLDFKKRQHWSRGLAPGGK